MATYIAEISKRKNQVSLINELNKYDLEKLKIKVLLIGDSLINKFEDKINNKNIIYIDFQNNVCDYINISDVIISSSTQEGLPLCILEAMHFNKRIIALNIRGNSDLLHDYPNGLLVKDVEELVYELVKKKKNKNVQYDISKYKIDNVISDVCGIYNKYLDGKLNQVK